PAAEPGAPSLASGTFGVYDERSKMNGLPEEGICATVSPDPGVAEPTLADASAVTELYMSYIASWSPFVPVGRAARTGPSRDSSLEPGVDPVGAPTVASFTTPSVEIFARGTNGTLYEIHNYLNGTQFNGWSDWTVVGIGFDSDPAAIFAD